MYHRTLIVAAYTCAGKRAGVVTTTRVTHATPSSGYAYSADRDWESDADVPEIHRNKRLCRDIAAQLVDDNADINVRHYNRVE